MAYGHRVLPTAVGPLLLLLLLSSARVVDAIELLPGDVILASQGDTILHLRPESGLLTPLASPGLVPRAGVVVDPAGRVVFTAVTSDPQSPSQVVARLDPQNGGVELLSADGLLDSATYDLAITRDGRLYVAAGHVGIVAIDPATGDQSLLATPPAVPPALAIASDETDRLWVASFAPSEAGVAVAELDPETGGVVASFAIPECADPRNGRLLSAQSGVLFLACSGTATLPGPALDARILRIDGGSGATSILTSGDWLEDPYGIAIEASGDVLVAGSGHLVHVDAATGEQTLLRTVEATGLAVVRAACEDGFDNDGDGATDFPADAECREPLDLAETENPCGDRLDNDGDGWTDHPDDPGCLDFRTTTESPSCDDGIDNDGDGGVDLGDVDCTSAADRLERPMEPGDLVVVDRATRALVRIDPLTGLQERLGERGALQAPTRVAVDRDRSLLVADPMAGALVRIDAAGRQQVVLMPGAGLQPFDLGIEAAGDLLVSDAAAEAVFRIERTTGLQTLLSLQAAPPGALALDGGELLVAEPVLSRIQRVDLDTGVQATETTAFELHDLALAESGELWIAQGSPGELLRWDPIALELTTVAMDLGTPEGLSIAPSGDAFATVAENASVVLVADGAASATPVSAGGLLVEPLGVEVVRAACRDGLDNDGDGWVDFMEDPGCDTPDDDGEHSLLLVCDDGVDDDGDGLADFPDDPGCSDSLDSSERDAALVCDDGLDNDGDGLGDAGFDPGCEGPLDGDETSPELACDNGEDDDGDGFADFPADPGCGDPSSPVEDPDCDDGEDDDGDGRSDHPDDPGCDAPSDDSEQSAALVCDDGIDQDGDKAVDAAEDPGCQDPFDPSERDPALPCDDGVDNDGDGKSDFPADGGCLSALDASELEATIGCDDGLDDDGDGATDYPDDPGCTSRLDTSERSPALACDDGLDNDGDGAIDYPADSGCAEPRWPVEAGACADGLDNDGDGAADFPLDAGCSAVWDLSESDALRACSNGVDDDGDGWVDDGEDPGCSGPGDPSEHAASLPCDNGWDEDGDGRFDYPSDPGCDDPFDPSEAEPGGATACDDGVDDDGDGLADFPADPGCEGFGDISERNADRPCDDGVDNDGDGVADFPADPDCSGPGDGGEWSAGDATPPLLEALAVVAAPDALVVRLRSDEPSQARLLTSVGTSPWSLEWRREHVLRIDELDCASELSFDVVLWDPNGQVTIERDVAASTLACGSGDALLARWRFAEPTGPLLEDDTGRHPATRQGPVRILDGPSADGLSLRFDGIDDRVDVPGIELLGNAVTFAVRVEVTGLQEPFHDGRFLAKATGTQEKEHEWMLSTIQDAAGGETRARFRLRIGGKTRTLVADADTFPIGSWVQVVAVWDGDEMRLYQDGRRVGVLAVDGQLDCGPPAPWAFGNQPAGAGDKPLDGRLDEVQMWERALSDAEIAALYGNQAPLVSDLRAVREPDRLVLTWTSDLPTSSTVRYRALGDPETEHVASASLTREHRVVLHGLSADTSYELEIESVSRGGASTLVPSSASTRVASDIPALPGLAPVGLALGLLAAAWRRLRPQSGPGSCT